MTTVRRLLMATVVLALLAVSTGTALAATRAVAAPCDDLAASIDRLQSAADRLDAVAAQVDARLAAGGLRPWQRIALQVQARALDRLGALLDARIDRLQARYDTFCAGGGDAGGEEEDDGGTEGEEPPGE